MKDFSKNKILKQLCALSCQQGQSTVADHLTAAIKIQNWAYFGFLNQTYSAGSRELAGLFPMN